MLNFERLCRRFLVSGRVQGVFYRASTSARARELQLCGYVRNLDRGRVEVVACGDKIALVTLQSWLSVGPPMAEVSEVWVESIENSLSYTRFEVL